ncbi:DUF4281 domain-containing protein [Sphingomonas sp. ID1715]|uniref:ABA4-like family protein n=1 Tax=Sphingomonas sp. ID1715 TaxID=1656898 RepID=UPI001488B742|nr:ABA4-like family protein [Sphingomonas sp. ID1715]NNM77172.1 DUF4281 domain-containing protein [Sphingomonas sp. ID1715]
MWQSLFGLTNGIALIAWAVLILAPRRPLPLTLVLYAGVGLLCLIYTALFVSLLAGWIDPVRDGAAPAFDYSVKGLRAFFMSDGGIVVGWTHYLALDLFTGLWIARDGGAKGIGRLVQAPVLFATFMAGPLGLLCWLALREPAARRLSKQTRGR